MARVDDRFLDCSIYLYPDIDAARNGKKAGGSGFVVAISAMSHWIVGGKCPTPGMLHLYAVSNRHVVEKSPVVRLNTRDGRFDVCGFQSNEWTMSEDDDLAAIPLDYQTAHKYLAINTDDFLTEERVVTNDVGVGDETFMAGRFINHEGAQRNAPTIRFGNLSMMPIEPVLHSITSKMQESFLVEIHSIPGYSGSPVFVRPLPAARVPVSLSTANTVMTGFGIAPQTNTSRIGGGPWLLGVEWGVITSQARAITGMSGVVPAWRLMRLLEGNELRIKRAAEQAIHK
ncbi:MAG TPA: hypothetical protein VG713_13860 [Pirellulales bacterium]|nr:hypothetical protein [Pirellulales bacterium]